MAHYAFLDDNNFVVDVIAGKDETELIEGLTPEEWYGNFRGQRCVRTSYNNRIRKQYAGIGFSYNEELDMFISPRPYPSWVLNQNHDWVAPVEYPEELKIIGSFVHWDEELLEWKL
jgi:hypothetical protein